MNITPDQARTSSPASLASEWYEAFQREALAEDGDPEAYISSLREFAQQAEPDSSTHKAFAVFMERMREDDIDLEADVLE